MNRADKKEIRERVISVYKMLMPALYKQFGSQYTSNEIRLEVLKSTQGHIMDKTTIALSKKVKHKKVQKAIRAVRISNKALKDATKPSVDIDISDIIGVK